MSICRFYPCDGAAPYDVRIDVAESYDGIRVALGIAEGDDLAYCTLMQDDDEYRRGHAEATLQIAVDGNAQRKTPQISWLKNRSNERFLGSILVFLTASWGNDAGYEASIGADYTTVATPEFLDGLVKTAIPHQRGLTRDVLASEANDEIVKLYKRARRAALQ